MSVHFFKLILLALGLPVVCAVDPAFISGVTTPLQRMGALYIAVAYEAELPATLMSSVIEKWMACSSNPTLDNPPWRMHGVWTAAVAGPGVTAKKAKFAELLKSEGFVKHKEELETAYEAYLGKRLPKLKYVYVSVKAFKRF